MIGYLEGRVAGLSGNKCLIITSGGVGYRVALPAQTLQALPDSGQNLAVYTKMMVREDAIDLYGFATEEEMQTFAKLVTISKVGAKTALAILSLFRPDDLRRMVSSDDASELVRVPGIGKKTAQHIFLELKDKLGTLNPDGALDVSPMGQTMNNVLDGLAGLGYAEKESLPVVREILKNDPNLSIAETLRLALKKLAGSK
ncbi:MAG: Holliday junction branch migration protein RuvA [Desulfovibrionaceae bacterium]|nr:Holliday junction branch migration protein RuvA [Desulfovibrionaceae bacterium]